MEAASQALYKKMDEIASGSRGCMDLSKKTVREIGLLWSDVEAACEARGLKIERRGNYGHLISKACESTNPYALV